jgi:hypothetical protein
MDDMVGGAKADVDTARSESLDGRPPSLEIDELERKSLGYEIALILGVEDGQQDLLKGGDSARDLRLGLCRQYCESERRHDPQRLQNGLLHPGHFFCLCLAECALMVFEKQQHGF